MLDSLPFGWIPVVTQASVEVQDRHEVADVQDWLVGLFLLRTAEVTRTRWMHSSWPRSA